MAFFDLFFTIELVVSLCVIGTCVGLIVAVPASRPYAGIGLGVTIIYITRLWRLLPSNRRYVKKAVAKAADEMMKKAAKASRESRNGDRGSTGNRLPRDTLPHAREPFNELSASNIAQGRPPLLVPSLLMEEQLALQQEREQQLLQQQQAMMEAMLAQYYAYSHARSSVLQQPRLQAPQLQLMPVGYHHQHPQQFSQRRASVAGNINLVDSPYEASVMYLPAATPVASRVSPTNPITSIPQRYI